MNRFILVFLFVWIDRGAGESNSVRFASWQTGAVASFATAARGTATTCSACGRSCGLILLNDRFYETSAFCEFVVVHQEVN
jgi:hypothetical protein